MPVRRVFFWIHLVVGLSLGLVILSMCATGTMLAFEPQLTAYAERAVHQVAPQPERLSLKTLLAKVQGSEPERRPTFITLKSDPGDSVMVGFGRDRLLFVNPYSGEILGGGSATRKFLHSVEEWHRWLGNKKFGESVTGAGAMAFLGLSFSGIFLWWPRRVLSLKGRGKARDWNWHNTFGLLASPFIIVITLTGLVMSSGILKGAPAAKDPSTLAPAVTLDALVVEAQQKNPHWTSITLRLPQRSGQSPGVFVQPAKRTLRAWITPLHTGRAWGIPGQIINLLVALAGLIQIWTGVALAYRRFRRRKSAVA